VNGHTDKQTDMAHISHICWARSCSPQYYTCDITTFCTQGYIFTCLWLGRIWH